MKNRWRSKSVTDTVKYRTHFSCKIGTQIIWKVLVMCRVAPFSQLHKNVVNRDAWPSYEAAQHHRFYFSTCNFYCSFFFYVFVCIKYYGPQKDKGSRTFYFKFEKVWSLAPFTLRCLVGRHIPLSHINRPPGSVLHPLASLVRAVVAATREGIPCRLQ